MALTYAFDATKETPESAARRRAIVAALMGRRDQGGVRSLGEGIGDGLMMVGDAIVARAENSRAEKGEQAGLAKAGGLFDSIASAIRGDGFPEAPVIGADAVPGLMDSGTDMATQRVASAFGDAPANDPFTQYQDAIASIESAGSGGYAAVGPSHPKLGRALGRYQVMEANIGPWSEKYLGRHVTPDEFLANPQIQDAIFNGEFGRYVNKYGPEGAAQAWFGGEGGVGKLNRRDSLGTSIGAYTDKFRNALGAVPAVDAVNAFAAGPQVASLDPSIGVAPAQPSMSGLTQDNVNAYAARLAAQMEQEAAPPQTGLPVGTPMATSEKGARVVRTLLDPQPMGGAPMPMQGMPAPAVPQQVAQAQPDMTRVSPMAGGSAGVRQPGQPSPVPLDMLIQAAGNPWLMANPGMANVVNTLLKQQMEAQDPMRAIDMDYRRAQIEKLNREAAGGNRRYGLNPIYGQDAQGNTVLGVLGDDGSFKPVDTGGVNISTGVDRVDLGTQWGLLDKRSGQMVGTLPKENYQEAFDTASGTNDAKSAAEARANLPKVEDNATAILGMIESLSTDPYLDSMVGPVSGRLPNVSADAARVQSKMDQIGGQAFLQAFETLRGGGQISNVEGERATAALARLNTAQSPQDYRQALEELSAIVRASLSRARRSAGSGSGNNPPPGASGDGWQDMGGVRIRRKQ